MSRKRSSFSVAKDIANLDDDSISAVINSTAAGMPTPSAELTEEINPSDNFQAEASAEAILISERCKSHFSLVSYCLEEMEYLKGFTLPGNLANEIFSTALLNGECSFARM